MNWSKYTAPDGAPIVGTAETLTATSTIFGIKPDGTPEYDGSTEINWDDQKTVRRDGKIIFEDDKGREWTFDQLVKVED